MLIREAVAAGRYYPASPAELKSMIESMVDKKAKKEEVIGLLSPHAGYPYSGPVTGAVISRIKFKDTFIVMGVNHTGEGKALSIGTEGVWQTPLGEVEVDSELAEKILASSEYLEEDNLGHVYEHSVELQLPFLQYFKSDFKFVPIVLSYTTLSVYREIGNAIAKAIKALKREAVIIASGDMTHYEPQNVAEQKDRTAIDAVLELDEEKLRERVEGLNITMCGYATASSLIVAAKKLGAKEAKLIKYLTSGDTTGDYSAVVGYAGIIIKGKEK